MAGEDDAGLTAHAGFERPPAQLADWRFLLAPPATASGRFSQVVVLGGPARTVERLRAMDIADHVSTTLDGTGRADAIVVFPPAQPPLALVRSTLATHGQLYLESDRASGAPATAGTLRRHGLAVDGIYAVPPLHQPRRYVPLDDARALRWYFATLYRPLTAAQRAAAVLVPTLGSLRLGPSLGRFARTVAIVARTSHALPRPSLGASLAAAVISHDVAPTVLLIGDGGDRVVLLPFARGTEPAPVMVLKVPRTPAFEARTEGEYTRVRELRRQLPAPLREAIPEPVALRRVGALLVAAERYARGRSMLVSSGSVGATHRRQLSDLTEAMRWLAGFHLATLRERVTLASAQRYLLEQPIESYVDRLGHSDAERSLFDGALAVAARCGSLELPVGRTHGDFAVWNLLRHGPHLVVTDWEGTAVGVGYADALHLVTSWDLAIRRPAGADEELQCFARLFLEPHHHDDLHRAAMRALSEYRRLLGIDDHVAPLLLLHHRLELALRRARQQADAGESLADRRGRNRAAAVVSLIARASPPPFASPGSGVHVAGAGT